MASDPIQVVLVVHTTTLKTQDTAESASLRSCSTQGCFPIERRASEVSSLREHVRQSSSLLPGDKKLDRG